MSFLHIRRVSSHLRQCSECLFRKAAGCRKAICCQSPFLHSGFVPARKTVWFLNSWASEIMLQNFGALSKTWVLSSYFHGSTRCASVTLENCESLYFASEKDSEREKLWRTVHHKYLPVAAWESGIRWETRWMNIHGYVTKLILTSIDDSLEGALRRPR